MAEVLHRADAPPWSDLTGPLLQHVATHTVVWIGFSGTVVRFELLDGLLTRTRVPAGGGAQLGDGMPVVVEEPAFWTACGCGDATGYRSTRALLVATVDRPEEIATLIEESREIAKATVAGGFSPQAVPPGHPQDPCGALHCPRATLATNT